MPRLVVDVSVRTETERWRESSYLEVSGHTLLASYELDGVGALLPEIRFGGHSSYARAKLVADALAIGLRAVLVEGAKP